MSRSQFNKLCYGRLSKDSTNAKKMIRQLAILAIAAICLTTKELTKEQKALYKFLLDIYENNKLNDEISKLEKDYDFESNTKTFDSNYKVGIEEALFFLV